jgi:hypothetical protein
MAPCGAIYVSALNSIAMALDDNHPVVMPMHRTKIAMHAVLGAGAIPAMVMAATLDDDGLRACDRRKRDDDHTQGGNSKTKLLHVVLLQGNGLDQTLFAKERSASSDKRFLNRRSE